MRKYAYIILLALIASTVYFTSCERVPTMVDPLLPDAEQIETPPEITEEMPEEMMEMPVDLVDVLIYTNRSFWITLEDAQRAAETTKRLLDSHGVQVEITKNDTYVREWMLHTTGDGNMNAIVLYGVLPASVYGTGNSQPDGSIAENWIETTDGDTILNHADYIGYNTDFDVDKVTEWTPDNVDQAVGSNREGGLKNLMDNPNIDLFTALRAGGGASMIVTSEGMALTPSLTNFDSLRPIPLAQLQGDWFAEKVFASDTGNAEATYADPVVVRDGDRGRLAIVHATTEHRGLLNGEVAAEIIINCLLAPPMMTTVETPPEPTVETPPEEIAVMVEVRKLYWGDIGADTISRVNPDGSNIETLISGVSPWSLALDIEDGKIYWVSLYDPIGRANLDGSGAETLINANGEGLGLDLAARKLYWAGGDGIHRANLDGSGSETLVTGLSKPDSMALDLVNRQVYWTDSGDGTIGRADLDGSNVETLVTGLQHPQGLNLDIEGGKMYWSNWPPIDKIQRANLDGSNIEDIAPGRGGLEGIVLDFDRGKMYWTDFGANKIQRANLDGSNIEDIVTTGLVKPISITLDIGPIN